MPAAEASELEAHAELDDAGYCDLNQGRKDLRNDVHDRNAARRDLHRDLRDRRADRRDHRQDQAERSEKAGRPAK